MRKLQMVLLALVAMFAFSALVASSASAEVTLLAEWLIGGNPVLTLTSVETEGEILLEQLGLADILCSGIFIGTIGPNGEDEITEVLDLNLVKAGSALGQAAVKCEAQTTCEKTTDVEVFPLNLPWLSILYLMESGNFLNLLFSSGAGNPAYEVACLVLGISVQKHCNGETSTIMTNNVGVDVNGEFNQADQEAEGLEGECDGTATLGIVSGTGLTKLLTTEVLSVSSV